MIAWIKNWVKKQVETNPAIMPFFDESKGWRWFFRLYFLVGLFILIDFFLFWFGVSGLLFSSMPEGQGSHNKIDTFREWFFWVILFFYLFGTSIYAGRVFSFTRKLTLEKKLVPKIDFLKYYPPRNNFFTNYVGILLIFYLLFSFSSLIRQGIDFIASIFEEETYVRIIALFVIVWGAALLAQPGIKWLDQQKPIFIHTCFGMVVLLYFLSFVWLVNYS